MSVDYMHGIEPVEPRTADEILNDMTELGLHEPDPDPPSPPWYRGLLDSAIEFGHQLWDILLNSFLFGFAVLTVIFLMISIIRAFSDDWYYRNIFTVSVFTYWILHGVALFLGAAWAMVTRKEDMPHIPVQIPLNVDTGNHRTLEQEHAIFFEARQQVIKNLIVQAEDLEKLVPVPCTSSVPLTQPDYYPENRAAELSLICPPMPGATEPTCCAQLSPRRPHKPSPDCDYKTGYCAYHQGTRPNNPTTDLFRRVAEAGYNYRLPEPGPCQKLQTYDHNAVHEPRDHMHVFDRKEFLADLRKRECETDRETRRMEEDLLQAQKECVCGPSVSAAMMKDPTALIATQGTSCAPVVRQVRFEDNVCAEKTMIPCDSSAYFKVGM